MPLKMIRDVAQNPGLLPRHVDPLHGLFLVRIPLHANTQIEVRERLPHS